MSDPYSVFEGDKKSDPYAVFEGEKSSSDPYMQFEAPAAQQASAPTPSVIDYTTSAGKGFLMGAKGIPASALQGMAGWQADRPAYPQGESPLDQAMRGEEQFAETYNQGPQGAPLPTAQHPLYQAGEALGDFGKDALKPAPGTEVAFDIGSGFGSVAGGIGMSMISPSAAMLSFVASGGGEAAERAVKAGATPEQVARASRLGTGPGATDVVDALIPSLGVPGKIAAFIGAVGAKAVIGAFAEGGQEGLQQLLQNAIEKNVYNPAKGYWEGVPYSALIGMIVGGATKPVLDRDPIGGTPVTEQNTKDAYSALTTPGSDPALSGLPPTPPAAPPTAAPSVVTESPIEQILNPPPVTPLEAHTVETSPIRGGVDSDVLAAEQLVKTPEVATPVRDKALTPMSDEELHASIYETLDIPSPDDFAKANAAPVQETSGPLDLTKLTKFGDALGSNPGGIYGNPTTGESYYIKQAPSEAHATNERVAAALYGLAGASTLQYVDAGPGNVATKLETLQAKSLNEIPPANLAELKNDFVTHAWLGNWDAVGLTGDNVGIVNDEPTWLDVGGALEYRAQGAPKGAAFGNTVGELETLRDPKINPQAAQLFGSMSDAEIRNSAKKVVTLSNVAIEDVVMKSGGSKALVNKLISRRDYIASKLFGVPSNTLMKMVADGNLDSFVDQFNFTIGSAETSAPGTVELTADAAIDALIETGTSRPLSDKEMSEIDAIDNALDEIDLQPVAPTAKPDLALAGVLASTSSLVPLSDALAYSDVAGAKAQILAHNKKITLKEKKNKDVYSFLKAKHVSTTSKSWTLYHGSYNLFSKFHEPSEKEKERGLFFSPSKQFAHNFGGGNHTYQVKVTPGKTKLVDLAAKSADKKFMAEVLRFHMERHVKLYGHKPGSAHYIAEEKMKRESLEERRKNALTLQTKKKTEQAEWKAKYGVAKLTTPHKTGYEWGGIHAAIELAREEGLDTLVLRNIDEGAGHDQIVVINPNRVFNTKTKQMMYNLAQGGAPRFDTSKLTPEAAAQREQIAEAALAALSNVTKNAQIAKAAVTQVVGEEAAARTVTPAVIKLPNAKTDGGWGGYESESPSGFYVPGAETNRIWPLIAVAVGGTTKRTLVTAYHEGWHAIEGTLTREEVDVLTAETENLRAFVTAQNPGDAYLYSVAEKEEIWAEAAAFYSYEQTMARAPAYNGPAAFVFEKIQAIIDAIKQAVRQLGFARSAEVFQRFYEGEMKERRSGLPVTMLERWWAQDAGKGAELKQVEQRLVRNTERNTAAMKAVDPEFGAVPAQQETLVLHDMVGKLFSLTHGNTSVPPQVQQGLAAADMMAWRHKWMWGLDRLVDLNPRFHPLLEYAGLIRSMRTDAARIQVRAQEIAKKWRRLKKFEELGAFLDDISNMTYRTPQEKAQGISRQPTQAEFQQLVQQHKLDAEALQSFQEIKNFFEVFLKLSTQNAIEEAQRTITNPQALMDRITAIKAQEAKLLQRPYFPFLRFGIHYVMVKDASGKVVDFRTFEKKGILSAERVQKAAHARISAKLPPGHTATIGVLPENARPFIGLPPELLNSIKSQLAAMPGPSGQAPGLTSQQLDAIEQLQYAYSPAASFAHRFQNKDYTPGYSDDFLRAFSRYAFQGSRYYSRVKYGWAVRQTMADAEATSKASSDNKVGNIRNFMEDHFYHTVLDSRGDFAWAKGAIFLWVFGFSVVGATTNMGQTFISTYPWLAARFGGLGLGDARAAKAIARAATRMQNFYKKGNYKQYTNFEGRAFAYAVETGRVSETQASELAGLAQGNTLLGVGNNKFRRLLQEVTEKSTWMFEMTEQANRRIAFAAALDLAQQQPNSRAKKEALAKYAGEVDQMVQAGWNRADAEVVITAVHATEQTQFVYAKENRPRFMRGKASILFAFQTYYLNMMQMMGADKKSTMPRVLLMLLLGGGLMGLPGADDLEEIVSWLGKKFFGAHWNAKMALKEFLTQAMSADHADVVLHGTARIGFGIPALLDLLGENPRGIGSYHSSNAPLPVLDRSKMFSMGQLLPIKPGNLIDPVDIDKGLAKATQDASGAILGVGFNMYRALMDEGSWKDAKRWELAMPRAMKDASSGIRAMMEERVRGKGGPASAPTVMTLDPRDPEQFMEGAAMILGYKPLRLNQNWEAIMLKQEVEKKIELEQKLVLGNRFEAIHTGREEELERSREKIVEFNENLPDWAQGYRITGDSLQRSMEARQRDKNAKDAGLPTQRRKGPLEEHINELFPNAIDVRRR